MPLHVQMLLAALLACKRCVLWERTTFSGNHDAGVNRRCTLRRVTTRSFAEGGRSVLCSRCRLLAAFLTSPSHVSDVIAAENFWCCVSSRG